mgnify:CR=1 FL=1
MDLSSVLAPVVTKVIIAKDNGCDAYFFEWAYKGVGHGRRSRVSN